MMHPDTELRWAGDGIGWGVFATSRIPRGPVVYVRDELELVGGRNDLPLLHPLQAAFVNRYGYRDEQGDWVVSVDNARFVNHSCESNTISTGYGFEIAVRDIEAGEEVTDDYGLLNLDCAMACECGSPGCRGQASPDDLQRYHRHWDAVCRQALAELPCVRQPLLELVPAERMALVERYLDGDKGAYRSVVCLAGESLSEFSAILLS